jgi:hypothetical protein
MTAGVGSGIGGDSGEEALGSSVEAGRVESPPVKACVAPSLGAGIAVTPETSDDSFDTMDGRIDVGRAEVTTGTLSMSSSVADDDQDELEDDDDDELDRYELANAESPVVSPVGSPTAVLAPSVTPAAVLPFATVARVITGPADESAWETCDGAPTSVSSPPAPSWSGVEVVTFGSPTTAVYAGDSMAGVVVWTTGELVITGTLMGEAVLSTANVDSMLEMLLVEGLLVARLDTAEIGIWLGTCRVGAAASVWPASEIGVEAFWAPAEGTGVPASGELVGTGTVLGGFKMVGSATILLVSSPAVEMIGMGSAVVTPLIGVEEAWLKIIVVSSVVTLVFVPCDVTGAGASEALRGVVVGTPVVMAGEVCCGTLELFDETSTTLEAEEDTGSLVDAESIMLDTAGTSVGDAWASVAAVDTLDEDILDDSGSSDCCDSIPVSIAVVIEGISEDNSDALEANSEGCAEMIKDGSWIDVGSPVASLGDVSAVAVSINRKLVVGDGPSE